MNKVQSSLLLLDLVQTLSGTHSTFDVQRANVLPMLLEQRHQEVNGQVDVLDQLILVHAHVSNGDAQAQDLKCISP